jgi:hypothetical protein
MIHLGLMERCVKTTALIQDIAQAVPWHVRDRIKIVTHQSLNSKHDNSDDINDKIDDKLLPKNKKFRLSESSYTPVIFETPSTQQTKMPDAPETESMRISGALTIDPQVRKFAESTGLKVSEHAVWLLVVAVKEFTKSLLKKTLSSMNAVSAGHIPPLLTRSFAISDNVWSTESVGGASKPDHLNVSQKVIKSSDLHAVIANLPISSRSLSGSVSRTVFERSLYTSINSSLILGGGAFTELKTHIISKITPVESKRLRVDSAAAPPPIQMLHPSTGNQNQETAKDYSALPTRGLGRGAKDLAALKARATSLTIRTGADISKTGEPAIQESVSVNVLAPPESAVQGRDAHSIIQSPITTIQASPLAHRNIGSNSITNTSALLLGDSITKSQSDADKPVLEKVSGSSDTSDNKSLSQSSRRGKGHGVKNLAAMRARSVTSSPDIVADLAAATAAESLSVEAMESANKVLREEPKEGTVLSTPAFIKSESVMDDGVDEREKSIRPAVLINDASVPTQSQQPTIEPIATIVVESKSTDSMTDASIIESSIETLYTIEKTTVHNGSNAASEAKAHSDHNDSNAVNAASIQSDNNDSEAAKAASIQSDHNDSEAAEATKVKSTDDNNVTDIVEPTDSGTASRIKSTNTELNDEANN